MERTLKQRLRRFLRVSLIILGVMLGPAILLWITKLIGISISAVNKSGEEKHVISWFIALIVLVTLIGVCALIFEGLKSLWKYIMYGK